ncbi:MAG: hypothetical protein JSV64_00570 [Candidatus Bathyarchaeota archaeon]|jgi:hypothetical protein|nr:MAG: hypothetical protein JSV64_00570 [Candidatus Bathyarchaeota archaeon]
MAGIYLIVFLFTLANIALTPATVFSENAPMMIGIILVTLVGALLALWVYEDGQSIKILTAAIAKLEHRLNNLEKSERTKK